MQEETFSVANVKCQGCVSNIASNLLMEDEVSQVEVDVPGGQVIVTGENLDRAKLAAKLDALGYSVITA